MPPRFAYWTILIDGKPTAFRARDKQELLPTFQQLRRTNQDIVFKYFARGRVWNSPAEAQAAMSRTRDQARVFRGAEKRGRDWRPGGQHKDPRARFGKSGPGRRKRFGKPRSPRADRPPKERPPQRRAPEPPRKNGAPEPPPAAEQIVIRPEPPERGKSGE